VHRFRAAGFAPWPRRHESGLVRRRSARVSHLHRPAPEVGASSTPHLPMDKAQKKRADLKLLYDMLMIRRFEEKAQQQYQMQKVGGFLHLYIGQEAVAVGSVAGCRPDDYIITAYRDHGHALARGMGMNEAMAEIFGKFTGCSHGLGGSMHYFDKKN